MRIECPLCGVRDMREFYYMGADVATRRPDANAGAQAWDDYLHNRDNPAGETCDLWQHEMGCGAWLLVTRDTVSHAVLRVALARDPKPEQAGK